MSPHEIEVGKTYHNGKKDGRYRSWKVLGTDVEMNDLSTGNTRDDGVVFKFIYGPFNNYVGTLSLESFAQLVEGEVTD
ncbi:hypothetical protein [Paenibacillus chitinolyticus]|uniref:hypothetical protein n=1 Tax=Paenibacillus chitinolyticus TaxID=79263 RepID=UPI0036716F94